MIELRDKSRRGGILDCTRYLDSFTLNEQECQDVSVEDLATKKHKSSKSAETPFELFVLFRG
jgi:hypothetical protein